MPGLRAFGRKWHVASDDYPPFALAGLLIHLTWAAVLIVACAVPSPGCPVKFRAYIATLLAVDVALAATYSAIMYIGLQGSILDQQRRLRLPCLLYIVTSLYFALLAVSIYGAASTCYRPECVDENKLEHFNIERFGTTAFAFHWATVGLFLLAMFICFDPFQSHRDDSRWQARCSYYGMICCWKATRTRNPGTLVTNTKVAELAVNLSSVDQLGAVFQILFAQMAWLNTPSDYATTLLLVGIMQKLQKQKNSAAANKPHLLDDRTQPAPPRGTTQPILPEPPSQNGDTADAVQLHVLQPSDPYFRHADAPKSEGCQSDQAAVPLEVLQESNHYFRHAAGVYGWMMQAVNHVAQPQQWGCKGCCSCCTGLWQHPAMSRHQALHVGRNMTIEAIHKCTGIDVQKDLLYCNFENVMEGLLPYYIALDRERKAVVVSIRGSLSKADWLTDLLCFPAEVDPDWIRPPAHSTLPPMTAAAAAAAAAAPTAGSAAAKEQRQQQKQRQGQSADSQHVTIDVHANAKMEDQSTAAGRGTRTAAAAGAPCSLVAGRAAATAAGIQVPSTTAMAGGAAASAHAPQSQAAAGGHDAPVPGSTAVAAPESQEVATGHDVPTLGNTSSSAAAAAVTSAPQAPDVKAATAGHFPPAAGRFGENSLDSSAECSAAEAAYAHQGILRCAAKAAEEGVCSKQSTEGSEGETGIREEEGCAEGSEDLGAAEAAYAHQGILRCAQAMADDLHRHGILRAVLQGDTQVQAELANDIYHQDCSGYKLVVTGHSLGAGVAALLALHLRATYPSLQCWAYAPPGGLMSPALSLSMQPFCTSVVVGKDLVPRLSVKNLEGLAERMLWAAARCKVSKTWVWLHALRPGRQEWIEEKVFRSAEDVDDEARAMLDSLRQGKETCGQHMDKARDFLPPGKLLYYEGSKKSFLPNGPAFKPRWISSEDFAKTGLLVSKHMLTSHMPGFQTRALDQALEEVELSKKTANATTSPPEVLV